MTRRVLIVERHSELRQSLRRSLAYDFPKAEVAEAATPDEAAGVAGSFPAHVVICDPSAGMAHAIRRIKAASPSSRVMVFSLHPGESHERHCLAAGADAYVTKGSAWKTISARVAELLGLSLLAEGAEGARA
jgi:DNA-binding NarL/FixJ family response regulator